MNHVIRNRLNLWLRAERAMGLDAVPRAKSAPLPIRPAIVAEAAAPSPQQPVARPATNARPAAAAPALLMPLDDSPLTETRYSEAEKARLLAEVGEQVRACHKCGLSRTRTNTVPGEGDPNAAIFFIGEGPGETEDLTGRPFVGKAGNLLDRMIVGMGLRREQVFIGNVVKCRPPDNRTPLGDEIAACTPWLIRQLEIIRPKVIVTLGLPAAQFMLKSKMSMGQLRGQWQVWRGIKLMPTYHPSYVLRVYTPEVRRTVWGDLKKVMDELGLKPPKGPGGADAVT